MRDVVRMRDIRFEKGLFENWRTGKIMDELLCSYKGLPKGVNYMVTGITEDRECSPYQGPDDYGRYIL